MEIKSTQGLSANMALQYEKAELQAARKVSEFSLRLNADGTVDKAMFTRLLTAARASKSYKNNADHYQFRLKSDSQGQYLTLKQQGLWSRFKGLFSFGSEQRQQQRAAAKTLIDQQIKRLPADENQNGRLAFANAKSYQREVMITQGSTPRHDSSEGSQAGSKSVSGPVTFSKLMDDGIASQEFVDPQHKSYQSYTGSEEIVKPNSATQSQHVGELRESNEYALRPEHQQNQSFAVPDQHKSYVSNASGSFVNNEEVIDEVESNRDSLDYGGFIKNFVLQELMKSQAEQD